MEYLPDIVIITILAVAVFFIVRSLIRGRGNGRCGGGCAGCSGCGGCTGCGSSAGAKKADK